MFVSIVLLLTFVTKGILSDEGFCENCLTDGSSGFCPYPTDCTRYVQCESEGDSFKETIRSCPFGQFWDSDKVTCRPSYLVRCEADPCRSLSTGSTHGMMGHGCRAFWKCVNGVSVASCCPPGTGYVKSIGCLAGPCDENCPASVGNPIRVFQWDQRFLF